MYDGAVTQDFKTVGPKMNQLQWYAIRTHSRHERVVSQQLEKQGIEDFLPTVTHTRKWSDRVKRVEMPLFSGYGFVRLVLSSPDRLRVLQTHGVAGFVGLNTVATPIPDSQIDDVRKLLASKIPFQEEPFLKVGQRVRIRGGALDGVEGILSAHHDDRSLVISIEPIQRSLSVRIKGYDVEPA